MKTNAHFLLKARAALILATCLVGTTLSFQNCGPSFSVLQNSTNGLSSVGLPPDGSGIGGTVGIHLPPPVTEPGVAVPAPAPTAMVGLQKGFATNMLLDSAGDPAKLASVLADMKAAGAQWVRMDFQWQQINDVSLSNYNTAKYDLVSKAVQAAGMNVLGIIDYSNQFANGNQDQMHPPDLNLFAAYATFLAAHFASYGVKYWEVWNEENTQTYWQPGVDAKYFKNLLAAAYPAIKKGNPEAFVILGGFAPAGDDGSNQRPQTFLKNLYAAGAQPYFDALADHPYTYTGDAYWFTNGIPELRQIMIDNGDSAKKIWLTESGSPSQGADPKFTEKWQADIISGLFTMYKNYDYLGPIFVYNYTDTGNSPTDIEAHFGLVRQDGSHKPSWDVFKNAK
jgi:hypothetical protein